MLTNHCLQGAVERIQKHDSGAAIVDSYKAMFKRMASERNALVERNVELEYLNQALQSQLKTLEQQNDRPLQKISAHPHQVCTFCGAPQIPVQKVLFCVATPVEMWSRTSDNRVQISSGLLSQR